MTTHEGLPVQGYRAQTSDAVFRVNEMKQAEERILRVLDGMTQNPDFDGRWVAIGRTQLEQAFMAINRAIFRPERAKLEDD